MAELSGFLPSISGDNKQGYQFLADWIAALISNGTYTTELQITADADMTINLPVGRAWINGIYYHNTTALKKTIAHADGVLARIDSVVLRLDFTVRKITSQILQGEYSTNPIAPPLTRTANTWDLKLADIYIGAGAIAISQADITDCRLDDNACGIVHCVVDHIETTELYNQIASDLENFKTTYEHNFETWSAEQKQVLLEYLDLLNQLIGKDAVGQLTQMIEAVKKTADAALPRTIYDPQGKATDIFAAIPGRNWFDNSDPDATVNQRGADKYEINNAGGNAIYTIDRWRMFCSGTCSYTVSTKTLLSTAEYLKAGWEQRFNFVPEFPCVVSLEVNGKTYTQVFTKANPFETKEVFDKGDFGLSLYTLGSVTSFTIYPKPNKPLVIGRKKLETGTVATPYVPKGYGAELAECLRYYETNTSLGTTNGLYTANTYTQIAKLSPKRIIPTINIPYQTNQISITYVGKSSFRYSCPLGGADFVWEATADL